MDQLYPDNGLVYQLNKILTAGIKIHLFVNNVVPTLSTLLSGLTEATFTGYVAVTQSFSNFTITGVSSHIGYAIAAPVTFNNTSGGPVSAYGYYITDSTSTVLLAIALFDNAPITVANLGSFSVLPQWGDFSQLSS